jgi:hypothetical protein
MVMAVLGWYVGSGKAVYGDQHPWLNLGIAGLIVVSLACGRWLRQGRRSVGERARPVLTALATSAAVRPGHDVDRRGSTDPLIAPDLLVAVPGAKRYHQRDCTMVAARVVIEADATSHEHAGRARCGVCLR